MPRNRYLSDLSFILLAALLLRILPIIFGSHANSDMAYFRAQAVPVLNNQNIYTATRGVFPYSPITMFIPALCLLLSNKLNIPFCITMKIPALIGDISLAIAIYYWVMRCKNDKGIAFKAAMLYAVNPLVILISAFQGNMMSLPTLFMFLAVMTVLYDCENNYRLSALLLGLAIAFRGYPILLLPLMLLKSKLLFSKKIEYIAYTILPVALIFLPFLIIDYRAVFREMFGYCGSNEYGYAAMERAISLYYFIAPINPILIGSNIQEHLLSLRTLFDFVPLNIFIVKLANYSRVIFLSMYLMVVLSYRKLGLLKLILATYLAFYFFYIGTASQYFIWIVPFLYFLDSKFSNLYIIFGTYAVISVYLCYHPSALFGRLPIHSYPSMAGILLNEFAALFLFWSLCGIWFFALLFKKGSSTNDGF